MKLPIERIFTMNWYDDSFIQSVLLILIILIAIIALEWWIDYKYPDDYKNTGNFYDDGHDDPRSW